MKLEKIYNNQIDETAYVGTHKSGLKVIILPKKGYTKSYALFATDFGSVNNRFRIADGDEIAVPDGIAHFLEHKLFEQPDDSNVFEEFSKFGGNANAFTSFDTTAYLFECTQNFNENLEILLDFVQKPHFTDENVAKEQGIIGQEIRMYDDDPQWQTVMNFLKALYVNYPLNIDIAGTVESIAEITPETLYACYNAFYNPNNMALCVTGNVDIDKICQIIDEHILENSPSKVVPVFEPEPTNVAKHKIVSKMDVSIPMFMIGFKDNDIGYDGKALLKKMLECDILTDMIFGKSSSLYNELYEKGLINDKFGAEYECTKNYGHISISGDSQDPDKVYETIIEALSSINLSEEDFLRLRKVLIGDEILKYNNIEGIAHSFLYCVFKNIGPFDFFDVINEITFDDIKNRFKMLFNEDFAVMSVVVPKE